jgi:lipoyl(octanoyl) transferase
LRIVKSGTAAESAPEVRVTGGLVPYPEALAEMEARAAAVAADDAPELIWLLQHPAVITAGTSARAEDLLIADRFELVRTGRGGELTFHGPGQRVVYLVLDLSRRGQDVRRFVRALEGWTIAALAELGVTGHRSSRGTGVWTALPDGGEAKICAIGVRIRRWITLHGIAINVTTDLSAFDAIVPCGIPGGRVTRVLDHCPEASMTAMDEALLATLPQLLGALRPVRLEGDRVSG